MNIFSKLFPFVFTIYWSKSLNPLITMDHGNMVLSQNFFCGIIVR